MAEEFYFDEWYAKMMAIPNEDFDEEIQRIDADRRARCEGWLRAKEARLKVPVKKEVEVPSKMVPLETLGKVI